jgi:hypothetical protein
VHHQIIFKRTRKATGETSPYTGVLFQLGSTAFIA